MNELIHIVYISFAEKHFTPQDLKALLGDIRPKNAERGITGLLLFQNGAFIQVIEGPSQAIHSLFEVIQKDRRHSRIVKLVEEPIEKRGFPDWSMGFRDISARKTSRLKGFTDLLDHPNPDQKLREITPQVRYLLKSFTKYT